MKRNKHQSDNELKLFRVFCRFLARRVHYSEGSRGGKRWPALAAEAN
jgi:hypothetical protein